MKCKKRLRGRSKSSGAEKLVNYFVGQVVGRMNKERPARTVMMEIVEEYVDTIARMGAELE